MRPCKDLCWVCETCRNALYRMELILDHEDTRAFAIVSDRDFVIGAIYFLGNEMHGNAFDGNLLGKTKVVLEAIEIIKKEYGTVIMPVPEHASHILKWAHKKLGAKDIEVLPDLWDNELDVIRMEV